MPDSPNLAYQTPRRPKPTRRDMAIRAINILMQEAAAAMAEPVPASEAVHLALDVLMHDGIAEDHQAGRFLEAMTTQREAAGTVGGYMRSTNMEQMIFTWQAEVRRRDRLGLKRGEAFPPDPFE